MADDDELLKEIREALTPFDDGRAADPSAWADMLFASMLEAADRRGFVLMDRAEIERLRAENGALDALCEERFNELEAARASLSRAEEEKNDLQKVGWLGWSRMEAWIKCALSHIPRDHEEREECERHATIDRADAATLIANFGLHSEPIIAGAITDE